MRWILVIAFLLPLALAEWVSYEQPILWIQNKRVNIDLDGLPPRLTDQAVELDKDQPSGIYQHDSSFVVLPIFLWGPERRNEFHASYLLPPSTENIFGTDSNGRDLFSRILYATRGALVFLAALFVIQIGFSTVLASLSALRLKPNQWILNTIIDCFESIPVFIVIMLLMLNFEMSYFYLGLAYGALTWPKYYQVAFSEMSKQLLSPTYEALKAAGANGFHISSRWLIPCALFRTVPLSLSTFAQALVWVSTADFFGFGLPAPTPTFGQMLSDGFSHFSSAWWLVAFPSAALLSISLASYFMSRNFTRIVH